MTKEILGGASYYARGLRYSGLRVFRRDQSRTGTQARIGLIDPFFGMSADDALEKSILDLPHNVLDVDLLVFRGISCDHDFERLAKYIKRRTAHEVSLAVLEFTREEQYAAPELKCVSGQLGLDSKRLLIELRDLELRAQILWSGAVQTPARSHFELPAGTHASSFIRVADALTDNSVVERWADWIKPELTANTVVVGDTWTILPLLQEVAWSATALGWPKAPIVTFPAYPTVASFEQVLASIPPLLSGGSAGKVIFLISVVSSQAFIHRIKDHAPRAFGRGIAMALLPLVGTHEEDSDAFVQLQGVNRFDVPHGESCALCRDSDRRPLIVIDRKRYAPSVEGSVRPQMLRADTAQRHRTFWQVANETDAVRVHVDDFSTGERRHFPVSLDIPKLLQDNSFRRRVISTLRKHTPLCDLVIIPKHAATESLRELVLTAYDKPEVFVLPRAPGDDGPIDANEFQAACEQLMEVLRTHREQILILDDAIINGRTVRSIHRLLQDVLTELRRDEAETREYEIHAFVIVGRPSTENRWKRLTQSLRQADTGAHLACAELLYLPDASAPCPWCEEAVVLQAIMGRLKDSSDFREQIRKQLRIRKAEFEQALEALTGRLTHLRPRAPQQEFALSNSVFICRSSGEVKPGPVERLSPHSLFGENLSEPVVYAAVTTALQEIRLARARELGTTYVWDIPKVLTAYHDPLLSAAFLRASHPEEIVITSDPAEFDDALAEISFASAHSEFRQSPILAAELEWALITERLPPEYADRIRERIDPILNHVGAPLHNALAIARTVRSSFSER